MMFSTKTQYGTRALLELAISGDTSKPMTVKEIAEKQGIPLDYLEHLINPLISSGIIRSVRGKKGGIILARPADQINVKEIVEQLDGPVNPWDVYQMQNPVTALDCVLPRTSG